MTLTRKLAVLGILGLTTGLPTRGTAAPANAAETLQMVKITASKYHFTPDSDRTFQGPAGHPAVDERRPRPRLHGPRVRHRHRHRAGQDDQHHDNAGEDRLLRHDLRSLLRIGPRRDEDDDRGRGSRGKIVAADYARERVLGNLEIRNGGRRVRQSADKNLDGACNPCNQ
jgi:hypothetical protein